MSALVMREPAWWLAGLTKIDATKWIDHVETRNLWLDDRRLQVVYQDTDSTVYDTPATLALDDEARYSHWSFTRCPLSTRRPE